MEEAEGEAEGEGEGDAEEEIEPVEDQKKGRAPRH